MSSGLFPIPDRPTAREQLEILEEQVAADPWAAGVPDLEAEAFCVVGHSLQIMPLRGVTTVAHKCGLKLPVREEHHRRPAIRAILRLWRRPTERNYLKKIPQLGAFGGLQPLEVAPAQITPERIETEWRSRRIITVTAVYLLRLAGWAEQIPAWLERLGPGAQSSYRSSLLASKLLMSELVRDSSEAPARKGPDQSLARQAKRQQQQAATLEQDYHQTLERQTAAQRQRRQIRQEAEALLQRARAEVAAAEQALARRLAAQEREREEKARKEQTLLDHLRQEIARTRQAFAMVLAQRTARVGVAPLKGRTLSVSCPRGEQEGYRLLVESAGGQLVERGGDLRIELGTPAPGEPEAGLFRSPESGLAAFERVLGRQVIPALPRLGKR